MGDAHRQGCPVSAGEEKTHFSGWDWAILALFIVGAVSRFWDLGAKSLWYDEITGSIWAGRKTFAEILGTLGTDSHPPLTALITHLFIVLGKSDFGLWIAKIFIIPSLKNKEFWLRLYPALCATLTFPLVWLLIRRHIGKLAALFTVLFMLLSPMNAYYSQDARPYAPWLLYTVIGAWFFLLAIQSDKKKHWIGFGIVTLAALYTHYFALLTIIAQGLFLLVLLVSPRWAAAKGFGKPLRLIITYTVIIAADMILFIPSLLQGFSASAHFVPPDPPFTLSLGAYYDLASNLGLGYMEALLFTLVLMGLGIWFLFKNGKSLLAVFLLIMFAVPFILAPIVIAATTKYWSVRFSYAGQWAMLGLAGAGAALFNRWATQKAPGIWKMIYTGVLIAGISVLAFHLTWLPLRTYYAAQKQDIRGAALFIQKNTGVNAVHIAFPPNLTGLFNHYKKPGFPPIFAAQKPDDIVKKMEQNDRALILTNSDELGDMLDKADIPWVYLEFERVAVLVADKNWHGSPYPERFSDLELKSQRTESLSLAQYYLDAGLPEQAESLLDGFIKQNPDDTPALADYARCLFMLGDKKDALHWIEQTLVRDEGNAWLWAVRANYLKDMDRAREAVLSMRIAVFLAPQNIGLRSVLAEWTK
jgi:tetratricopeptide (TPR) repeat protein